MKREKYTCKKTGKILDKITYYYESGEVQSVIYHLNHKYHREDGPAIIHYYESGEVRSERYYLNDYRHREDGPARIWYHKSGKVSSEFYYLNDKKYTGKYHNNKWMKIHLKNREYLEIGNYLYTKMEVS